MKNALLALAALLALTSVADAKPAKKARPAKTKNPVVVIETSLGTIRAELYRDKTPNTVKNFLGYVDKKHYDGTIFHRVIAGFMIQGGGFDADLNQKETGDPIDNEAVNAPSNSVGTLAMARTSDPDSATAQFFINTKDNRRLDRRDSSEAGAGYCVFGKVIAGMDVVRKIEKVATGSQHGMDDVPVQPVVIKSIRAAK